MAWIYLILSVFISTVTAQIGEDSALASPITLPPELQQKFNETEVEKYKTQYLEQFKKKCEENGHPELFESAQTAATNLMTCFNELVNMEVLQQEIEDAKPTGQVDEVFKNKWAKLGIGRLFLERYHHTNVSTILHTRLLYQAIHFQYTLILHCIGFPYNARYCVKTPDFKGCFRNMTETVKPCFSPPEQKNFKTLYNVTEQLADFICFKDGDRIALFIAEGGKECFQDKSELIQDCLNSTFDAETTENLKNITDSGMLQLEFKEKQCNQMTTLQKCVVNVLEKCPKPTSANIVDSLFNFIRKATPCKQFVKEEQKSSPGAASGLAVTTATLITALAVTLIA